MSSHNQGDRAEKEAWNPLAAIRWAIDSSDLDAKEKLTYVALVRRCDDNGLCRPSVPRIAEDTAQSQATVMRATASLSEKGALEVYQAPRGRRANRYLLHPDITITQQLLAEGYMRRCTVIGDTLHTDRSHLAQSETKLPIEDTHKNKPKEVTHSSGHRKRRTDNDSDPRVSLVFNRYTDAFKARYGVSPTPAHIVHGRDGNRVRSLPKEYTEEVLTAAIDSFFDLSQPGYIVKDGSFTAFLGALPQLIQGGVARNERSSKDRGKHTPPSSAESIAKWITQ